MDLRLRHVVVCRFPQETAYAVPCPTLSFTLAGLEFHESPGLWLAAESTGIFFAAQGLPVRFRYSEQRENFAILFDSHDVRAGRAPDRVEVRHNGEWVALPVFVAVDAGRLEGWRLELERIRTSFLMPTATNRLRAELGTLNLIRYMLDAGVAPAGGVSPAGKLKNLIDADAAGARSMSALCAECGYSPDHLRLLFVKSFGATPKQYRIRRRMAEAMEWIAGSRLSAKEIAARLGFSQMSHFSAAFKAVHGMQPREAIRRFRGTGEPSSAAAVIAPTPETEEPGTEDMRVYCPDMP
jgi:AraC-like DNA-binding protein